MRLVIGRDYTVHEPFTRSSLRGVADALLRGNDLLDFEGYLTDSLLEPVAPCGELFD